MHNQSLFSSINWHEFSDRTVRQACGEASNLDKAKFEANGKEQIIDHISSKYELQPLVLHVDEKEQDIVETSIDVSNRFEYLARGNETVKAPAYKVVIQVPFSGPDKLFEVKPSTSSMHMFGAEVFGGKISFSLEFPESSATAEAIELAASRELGLYTKQCEYIKNDLAGFNERLRNAVSESVSKRHEQITKLDSIKTALKVPIEKSSNPSPLNQVKITPKKISPLSTKKEDLGACISDDDYDHILESMRAAGVSMETNRATEFHDEEALRDLMLVVLSSSMVGGVAAGELFHKTGKTDIAIPFENKATFVAECKLWKGEKNLLEGIDQLLGYTTWRDAKTALVIFNKDNSNFSAIQEQITGIFENREDYVKSSGQREGEWRFVLTKPDDPGRHIEIHVLLFDLYSNKP